jgi:small nuclear ribonucleoprotein (snRNP)-like protein
MAPKTVDEVCKSNNIEQDKADADLAISQLSDVLQETGLDPSTLRQTVSQVTNNCDIACENKKKVDLLYGTYASSDCQAMKYKAWDNLLKALRRSGNNDYSLLAPSIKKELEDGESIDCSIHRFNPIVNIHLQDFKEEWKTDHIDEIVKKVILLCQNTLKS